MAFRKRFRTRFRRFRKRWDMQTFRECERDVPLSFSSASNPDPASTCNDPQTYADYLCGIGPSTAGAVQMKPGASRMVTFGGAHLRLRLNAAIVNSRDAPCSLPIKVVLAVVKLPLLEDEVTPAYLPNLAISRNQLSTVNSTESDSDEDILWWHDEQLDLMNIACFANGDQNSCIPLPDSGSDDCCQDTPGIIFGCNLFTLTTTHAAALYGRMTVDRVIRAKRRIREREALFLVQHYIHGLPPETTTFNWLIRRNVYFRYAVR